MFSALSDCENTSEIHFFFSYINLLGVAESYRRHGAAKSLLNVSIASSFYSFIEWFIHCLLTGYTTCAEGGLQVQIYFTSYA